MPIRVAIIFYLIVLFGKVSAQDFEFKHFSVKDGLPSNEIYHVLEDRHGYLWFSTDRGISRYNGYEFENFNTDDGLKDNTVFFSSEDEKGKIWFLSFSPYLCYYSNGKIEDYENNKWIKQLQLSKNPKVDFHKTQNSIRVGTLGAGYYEISDVGPAKLHLGKFGMNISEIPNDLFIYSQNSEYPSYFRNHRFKFPPFGRSVTYKEFSYKFNSSHTLMPRYSMLGNEALISDGTNLYRISGDSIKLIHSFNHRINCLYTSKPGSFFVGFLDNGVVEYELANEELITKAQFLNSYSISWINKDVEGGMWFTTIGDGVFYKAPGFQPKASYDNDIPNKHVHNILFAENGRTYISFKDGSIWQISDSKGSLVKTLISPQFIGGLNPISFWKMKNRMISKKDILDLLPLNIDDSSKFHYHRELKKYSAIITDIVALSDSRNSGVWVGTNKGVLHFDSNLKLKKVFFAYDILEDSIAKNISLLRVDKLFASGSSNIYVSSIDGLFKIHDDNLIFLGNEHFLLKSRIDDIHELNNSTMLLASRGHGLIVWNNDTLFSITTDNGLSNNILNAVYSDNNNNIWVGTNNGLDRVVIDSGYSIKVTNYSKIHGLPSNQVSAINIRNNQIWVGTAQGIHVIDKNELKENQIAPRVNITQIKINERDTLIKSNYQLKYDENFLYFAFDGISFQSQDQISYKYYLSGLEKDWHVTNNREVRYSSVPPGKYEFTIKAANSDGYWSEPKKIFLEIRPPYWKTWWFILTEWITILIITTFFVFNREKKIKMKEKLKMDYAEVQKRSAQLELSALRAQMNPHFTFNTLSSIQKFILKHNKFEASDYLSKFATLIRVVLENSQRKKISLQDEINALKMYLDLEKIRFDHKFNYDIVIDPKLDLAHEEIPPTILQPLIENSIIHGIANITEKGQIEVKFERQNNEMNCYITDNGVGIKSASEKHTVSLLKKKSLGIKITKERLATLSTIENKIYSISITDKYPKRNKNKGTVVQIVFPLNKNQHDR